jgi:hypothetical protein
MLEIFLVNSVFLISQLPTNEPQFDFLKKQLEHYKFHVIIEPAPERRARYGQLNIKTREIWINPVDFDLKIATPTLIHEAVHAAQVCKGKGEAATLDLDITPINYARPFYMNYDDIHRKDLEMEAYAVQTQPTNSFELVLSLLSKYCR